MPAPMPVAVTEEQKAVVKRFAKALESEDVDEIDDVLCDINTLDYGFSINDIYNMNAELSLRALNLSE